MRSAGGTYSWLECLITDHADNATEELACTRTTQKNAEFNPTRAIAISTTGNRSRLDDSAANEHRLSYYRDQLAITWLEDAAGGRGAAAQMKNSDRFEIHYASHEMRAEKLGRN